MTVHINALKEDISNIVIMPGDPNRAKRVAETYLDDYKLVNTTRGMLGYTGNYKGKKVTVKIKGKSALVKNVYKNTKIAKVVSKKTAKKIKIKGLKKGKTTLKIKVNGVTLKLKVKVK